MVDRTKQILKGAVATHKGWVDPKTGELLVSIRGLPDAVVWTKRNNAIEELTPTVDVPEVKEVGPTAAEIAKLAYEVVNPTQRGAKKNPVVRKVRTKAPKAD
jgi:hypothetical protein